MDIKRHVFKDLQQGIGEPQVLILTGPLQVGKTTLMRHLESKCQELGKRTRFLDLEQPQDLARLTGDPGEVIEALIGDIDVVFVDEFYYLADAGRIFKSIYDHAAARGAPVKIVASGSSSTEIHGHLQESLAGRTLTYQIYPVSWQEYSSWASPDRPGFDDYLRFGGLPGLAKVSTGERKQQLLEEYLSAYLFKDIKALIREENIRAFNHLLQLLATHQGQLVEFSKLARELRVNAETVASCLSILDRTYVNFLLPSFHTNLANELKKSRKTYLYDLGVRNSILRDFRTVEEREDRGAVHETFVFLTLRALLKPNMELRFWRTKRKEEVDFVLVVDRVPFPIEVKSHLNSPHLHSGLRAFCRKYPSVTQTFTVSDRAFDTIQEGSVLHHFLDFESAHTLLGHLQ